MEKWAFEKLISTDEMRKKTKEYQTFVLYDIFSEKELKEYMDGIRDIVQKDGECEEVGKCTQDNNWFYTNRKDLHYFLEEDTQSSKDIKEKDEVKKQSCLNLGNSEQTNLDCEVGEYALLNQYDEDTVLLQIPQDDTKIEDVTKKFKDLNKVINTIIILKEKGKIIVGQGYIRRPSRLKDKIDQYDEETVLQMIPEEDIKVKDFIDKFENPNKVVDTLYILEKKGKVTASHGCMRRVTVAKTDNPDSPEPLNTWTCGMCGIKFKAQIPYEDYNGHAVCKNCWKKLVES